jgi:hypothetical protein
MPASAQQCAQAEQGRAAAGGATCHAIPADPSLPGHCAHRRTPSVFPKTCSKPNIKKHYDMPSIICPNGCQRNQEMGVCVCSAGNWAACGYGLPTCNCGGKPLCVTQVRAEEAKAGQLHDAASACGGRTSPTPGAPPPPPPSTTTQAAGGQPHSATPGPAPLTSLHPLPARPSTPSPPPSALPAPCRRNSLAWMPASCSAHSTTS